MRAVLCVVRVGCLLLLAIAPWLFTFGLATEPRKQWSCETAFEVLRVSSLNQQHRAEGHLSQHFRYNGQGLARLNGRVLLHTPGQPADAHTFHRVSEFTFSQAGPYVKKRIDKVVKGMGDTLPDDWVLDYFHEPTHDYYLQVMHLGGKAYALGAINMPRLYCAG